MRRFRQIGHGVVAALALFVAACDGETPPPAVPSMAAAARARQSAQHDTLLGRWRPTLEAPQARSVELTRHALAEPPNEAAFARMAPTTSERDTYQALVKLRLTDPSSPRLADVRRKLAQYDALFIEITPAAILTPATDTDAAKREEYTVLDDTDGGLTLEVGSDHERVTVTFHDKDHISLGLRSGAFRLSRDGAVSAR
jgi:hypothetical protein